MLSKLKDFFYNRMARSGRIHPLYIIPTFDGIKVVALNLTLLVIGLVYANNYVLLFNFVLFCLFLGSMFYTHFNLSGLKLESIQLPSFHAGEDASATFHFSTSNSQGHFFIRPYFKSALIKFNNEKETFNISASGQTTVKTSLKGMKRGKERISALYLETTFPLNFFRCFTFFNLDQDLYIYPVRENLNLHEEIELVDHGKEDGDEFFIRDYQSGDSPKRVDWKKLAQTNRWYTRQYQNAIPSPVMLVLNQFPKEEELKSVSFALYQFHQQNIKYGLKLGKAVLITPENSPRHLNHCLRELASL